MLYFLSTTTYVLKRKEGGRAEIQKEMQIHRGESGFLSRKVTGKYSSSSKF